MHKSVGSGQWSTGKAIMLHEARIITDHRISKHGNLINVTLVVLFPCGVLEEPSWFYELDALLSERVDPIT